MKEGKIKPLLCVEDFANYFTHKAKRILKLKKVDFDSVHIDYFNDTEDIWVWFHRKSKKGIVGVVSFTLDGKQRDKTDNQKEAK